MEAYYAYLNSLFNQNKNDFSDPSIPWLNPYRAGEFQEQRDRLLQSLEATPRFKATKPFYRQLSPGCAICGEGQWSCLFITNRCNAACFYCPASQTTDEIPSTQGLNFEHPETYAEYVRYMGFRGVSFSGGEPLLYFDRTLAYLKAVRKTASAEIYTWMYTNGLLAEKDKLHQLADAGLNEIRFDIGATGFNLERVKQAQGIIPTLTIEIPAVPEEKDRLIALLPAMAEAGVSHLNLHQLRMTAHNAPKLLKRNYTLIPAERPLVLESELAALEIIEAAQQLQLPLGVNYCSFHFKHRFQKAGFRTRLARQLLPEATLTENGYLREYFGKSLSYKSIALRQESSGESDECCIDLQGTSYYYSLRTIFQETVDPEHQKALEQLLGSEPSSPPDDGFLFRVWQLEYIERGLREY